MLSRISQKYLSGNVYLSFNPVGFFVVRPSLSISFPWWDLLIFRRRRRALIVHISAASPLSEAGHFSEKLSGFLSLMYSPVSWSSLSRLPIWEMALLVYPVSFISIRFPSASYVYFSLHPYARCRTSSSAPSKPSQSSVFRPPAPLCLIRLNIDWIRKKFRKRIPILSLGMLLSALIFCTFKTVQ